MLVYFQEAERSVIMKAVPIIFAIALAIIVILLLRFIMKRLWLFYQLKRFAKEHNYTCTMPLVCLLPFNSSSRYVQIKTTKTVYNTKLFGLLQKHCEIHFWSEQEYSTDWYLMRSGFIAATPIGLTNARRRRSLGKTEWLTADDGVPILLISPAQAPVRITQTNVNHLVHLRAGEKIGDAIFADLDYLLRYIEKQENR